MNPSSPQLGLRPCLDRLFGSMSSDLVTAEASLHSSEMEESPDPVPLHSVSSTFDFSGFDLQGRSHTPGLSVSPLARKLRLLKETLKARKTIISKRRLSLSPIFQDMEEMRNTIKHCREISRARTLSYKRKLTFSPPHTRSKGPVGSLPLVQPRI